MSTELEPERLSELFLLFLCLSAFTVSISNGIIVLFSVDIASTYHISQGIAVQIRPLNSTGELIVGVILSVIALHFDYRKLRNLGFPSLLFFYTFLGKYIVSNN
jgi:hypothetical protein